MKKLICIMLCLPALAWALAPDNEAIFDEITMPASEHYYPNLMLRFEMGDTTLTVEDYHYLYYGFAYQDDYKPLSTNNELDKMMMLIGGLDIDNPLVAQLEEIIITGNKALVQDPFNPQIWNLMAFAYGALGNPVMERASYDKVQKILAAIDDTGSGVDKNSPKHILMFSHAVDLLCSQNINPLKPRVISRTVQYTPFLEPIMADGKKVKGYYFDFGRIYWNKPDSVTYHRDRTWQFNNLKPREYK